jgi:integrase
MIMTKPALKNPTIEAYLQLCRSKATAHTYRTAILKYFKFLDTTPEKYLKQKRDFNKDFSTFNDTLKDYSSLTQKQTINAIKKFLEFHDISIKNSTLETINKTNKRPQPTTDDRIPTNEELKKILSHGTLLDKTIYSLMATSGLRVNESTHITWDDIDLDNRRIHVRAEIAKYESARYTFFTEETRDLLLEWQKERTRYFEQAKRNAFKFGNKKKLDNRVFPVSTVYIQVRFNKLLESTGSPVNQKDSTTGRYKIHTHSLRKFFSTQLQNAGVEEGIVETLLGHKGYCNGSYKKFTEQQIKEKYDNNSMCLSIFTNIEKIQPRIEQQDKKLSILREENDLLKLKILRLEEQEKNLDALVQEKVERIVSQVMNYTK